MRARAAGKRFQLFNNATCLSRKTNGDFFYSYKVTFKPVSYVILFTYVQIFYTFQLPELFRINFGF